MRYTLLLLLSPLLFAFSMKFVLFQKFYRSLAALHSCLFTFLFSRSLFYLNRLSVTRFFSALLSLSFYSIRLALSSLVNHCNYRKYVWWPISHSLARFIRSTSCALRRPHGIIHCSVITQRIRKRTMGNSKVNLFALSLSRPLVTEWSLYSTLAHSLSSPLSHCFFLLIKWCPETHHFPLRERTNIRLID